MTEKNSNVDEDGYGDKIPLEPSKSISHINTLPSDANSEKLEGTNKVNDTTIPSDINGDDEIQQGIVQPTIPEFGNLDIQSNFPDKKDLVPMKDRISPKIRNDDNPADIDY